MINLAKYVIILISKKIKRNEIWKWFHVTFMLETLFYFMESIRINIHQKFNWAKKINIIKLRRGENGIKIEINE